jgi:hypothetical protein
MRRISTNLLSTIQQPGAAFDESLCGGPLLADALSDACE